jgi:hypothetical protein
MKPSGTLKGLAVFFGCPVFCGLSSRTTLFG